MEKLISKNYYLNQSARDGFRSYVQSYASYSLKKIFSVHDLDLAKVAKAFGFSTPPAVNLPVGGLKEPKLKHGEEMNVEGVNGNTEEEGEEDGEETRERQVPNKRRALEKRKEMMGEKNFAKEVYRKKSLTGDQVQWSRWFYLLFLLYNYCSL